MSMSSYKTANVLKRHICRIDSSQEISLCCVTRPTLLQLEENYRGSSATKIPYTVPCFTHQHTLSSSTLYSYILTKTGDPKSYNHDKYSHCGIHQTFGTQASPGISHHGALVEQRRPRTSEENTGALGEHLSAREKETGVMTKKACAFNGQRGLKIREMKKD